jgi:hypothetical protein
MTCRCSVWYGFQILSSWSDVDEYNDIYVDDEIILVAKSLSKMIPNMLVKKLIEGCGMDYPQSITLDTIMSKCSEKSLFLSAKHLPVHTW